MKRIGLAFSAILAIGVLIGEAVPSAGVWQERVAAIGSTLDRALAACARGDRAYGKELASDAYFDGFENESNNMEVAVRVNLSGKKCYELESQFSELRQAIGKGAALDQLTSLKTKLMSDLDAAARELDAHGQASVPATAVAPNAAVSSTVSEADAFGKSFLIILREGFEIILLLGAISAFLIKSGARDKLWIVAQAVVVGILASGLTAAATMLFVNSLAVNPEIVEGVTLMLAAIVLFFVSHWLISSAESKHWIGFIKSKVNVSLSSGNVTALWVASFLAVYREGAETVLFYQGLSSMAPTQGKVIAAGFVVGIVALGAMFLIFRRGILRIPPRPFFRITSAMLYYMAFVFAGKAVIELQAGQVIHLIPLPGWPTIDLLGFYPTLQSVAVQMGFILAILVSLVIVFARRQTQTTRLGAA
jgi:high-affinity iron transporter